MDAQQGPRSDEAVLKKRLSWLYISIFVVVAAAAGLLVWYAAREAVEANVQLARSPQPNVPTKSTATPQLTTETVVSGRDHVWEIAFLPTKEMLFTERKGDISALEDGTVSLVAHVPNVYANGEGGLLGLAIDPNFSQNRFIYACYVATIGGGYDIRVSRWRLKDDISGIESQTDIITGMVTSSTAYPGRHSGCRIKWGPDGVLWVGTGDVAQGDTGLQPKKLGGKVLRVDRDGNAVEGNLGGNFDTRIYSYGHRNVQGLAFFPKPKDGVLGISVEHGSDVDDEVNLLVPGNFGWAPPAAGYQEKDVPMTDLSRFPDAITAIWKSGKPTQAPSGATFLRGTQWKGWDGALAITVLKDHHLKILQVDDKNLITHEDRVLSDFGRLRTAVQGPDGNVYISTDNGGSDQIIRVIPH